MRQLTVRLSDELAARLKQAAADRGQSVNGWVSAVLAAAVDPELADGEATRVRERLARAGLLAPSSPHRGRRPDPTDVARARAAAGRGRSLSGLVSEDRG